MLNDRRRILELALETLEVKKGKIEEEIAAVKSELQGKSGLKKSAPKAAKKTRSINAASKSTRFTKEERLQRSRRMKKYWDNWRKKNAKSAAK